MAKLDIGDQLSCSSFITARLSSLCYSPSEVRGEITLGNGHPTYGAHLRIVDNAYVPVRSVLTTDRQLRLPASRCIKLYLPYMHSRGVA